jgi:hypothetical protein
MAPIAKAIPAAKLASGVEAREDRTESSPGGKGDDILAAKLANSGVSSLAACVGEEVEAASLFFDFLDPSAEVEESSFRFIPTREKLPAITPAGLRGRNRRANKIASMSNPDDSLLDSQNSIFGDASQDITEHGSNAMEVTEDLNKDGSKVGAAPFKRNDNELNDITEEPEEKDDVQGLGFPTARVQRIMRKHPDKKKRFVKEAVHAVAIATVKFEAPSEQYICSDH